MAGEGWVRRAGDADGRPPGFRTERLGEGVSALGVQDDVVVVGDRFEVLGSVVDDDVGTEVADPFDVAGAGRRGHRRPQVLGQLDRGGADAPGAGVDQHLLAELQVRSLDEACQAVRATRATEAASAMERFAGLIARSSSSTAMRSAKVPMRPSRVARRPRRPG